MVDCHSVANCSLAVEESMKRDETEGWKGLRTKGVDEGRGYCFEVDVAMTQACFNTFMTKMKLKYYRNK
jgi:hypothetical protein